MSLYYTERNNKVNHQSPKEIVLEGDVVAAALENSIL